MKEAKISYLPPELQKPEDKFLEMLALPKFQEALNSAAHRTWKTGLETAFEVFSFPDSPFVIEGVKEGMTDTTLDAKVFKEIDGQFDYTLPHDYYFDFHFHPGQELIIPSAGDLKLFTFKEISERPRYVGIGEVAKDRKIAILILAKPRFRLGKHDLEFYDEVADTVTDYGQLQTFFSSIGISSFLLEY